jgi:hypothetical protein
MRLVVLSAAVMAPLVATAQSPGPKVAIPDSVTIAAGAHYRAGGFHRFLFGGVYRDLWTTPIRVPVLDLATFGGGLRPLKEGGGNQTASLRLVTPDGVEYVFRSVDKDAAGVPADWKGTVVDWIALDQTSSAQPAGILVAAPILDAAGVLHVRPVFVVMPDDPALGKYRTKYAGRLGGLELAPAQASGNIPGFAGALQIIDSDSLLKLVDQSGANRPDAAAFLTARLVDMLLNDRDRHAGQWKWARLSAAPDAPWQPIPRDRDKVLISSSGFISAMFGSLTSDVTMIGFSAAYPSLRSLTFNSAEFDRRFLAGLDKPTWDSVAGSLVLRITDAVIDSALAAMPLEYHGRISELAHKLRARRDALPDLANRLYAWFAGVVDVHATDAADRATITRIDDNRVDVRLESALHHTYFDRRFDARETQEIRVFMHGGADTATVIGDVRHSLAVRVIGGNGANLLVDSSSVAGHRGSAHLYNNGTVTGVVYGDDTVFSRRPLLHLYGSRIAQRVDHGKRFGPVAGLAINHDVGFMPGAGVRFTRYGFETYPYAMQTSLVAQYSLKLSRYRVGFAFDRRQEDSPVHFTIAGGVSQLEMTNFFGYGNATRVFADSTFFDVHQQQWSLHPAIALTLGTGTELSFGPLLKHSVTDTLTGRYIASSRPYGFGTAGRFDEAGLEVGLLHDGRDTHHHAHRGTILDVHGAWFPALGDVRSAFGEVDARGAMYFTIPALTHPFIGLQVGAKKLLGDFPVEEAALIGGTTNVRTLSPGRFAGDAAVFATGEIRIPAFKFTLLVPLHTGLLATYDMGRVYVDGDSPGGWHSAFGAGFWIGFREMTADIRVMRSESGHPVVLGFHLAAPGGQVR